MTHVGVFGNVLSPLIDMVIHSFALRNHKYISITIKPINNVMLNHLR